MNIVALSRAELPVLQEVGRIFLKEIDSLGKPFVRQMVIEAHKAGLQPQNLQYLFFTVVERPKEWPVLSPDQKRALLVGRNIMVRDGVTPEYRDGLVIPDVAEEAKIDKAIERVAFWCQTGMTADLIDGYDRAIKTGAAKIRRVNPEIPPQFEETYVQSAFEDTLATSPGAFLGSAIMSRVIFSLF